jgi:hypothetical protein
MSAFRSGTTGAAPSGRVPRVVQLADVRMVQRGHRAGLAREPFGEFGLRCLDRNNSVQAGVAGPVDLAHSTGADRRKDFVGAEFVSGREPHVRIQLSLADQTHRGVQELRQMGRLQQNAL